MGQPEGRENRKPWFMFKNIEKMSSKQEQYLVVSAIEQV